MGFAVTDIDKMVSGTQPARCSQAELGESPEGQRAVAEIRQLADSLRTAFAVEPTPALPQFVREKILAAAAKGEPAVSSLRRIAPQQPSARRPHWLRRCGGPLVAVGGIVVVTGAVCSGNPSGRASRRFRRGPGTSVRPTRSRPAARRSRPARSSPARCSCWTASNG